MSEKDFFRALRAKLERRPSASFDSDFWRKFDREFGEKSSFVSRWFTLPRAMIASAAALGMIVGGRYALDQLFARSPQAGRGTSGDRQPIRNASRHPGTSRISGELAAARELQGVL